MKKSSLSLSLFKPEGRHFTLPKGFTIDLTERDDFTTRHHPLHLQQDWNLTSYSPGEYGLFQIQRPTTANELSLAVQICSVSYLPGALLLAINLGYLPQAGVISFASFVEEGLGVKRQLYVAPSSDSDSDNMPLDKWMIEGSECENPPVLRDVQAGVYLLVCFKRFGDDCE